MHLSLRFVMALSAALVLAACSDSGSSNKSTSVSVEGWVGAQGLNSAQVIANPVDESGQASRDTNGIYVGLRESSNSSGKFSAAVVINEATLFVARGQIKDVDKDKNNLATTQLCQVKAGCSVSTLPYAFGSSYPATTGFEWKSIVYNADRGSRNNINAITTLAEAFAYSMDVKNQRINDAYTTYDIVLANSQVANLLGLSDIIGDLPANLTRLDSLSNNADTKNQIRYSALLAGLQHLTLAYAAANTAANSDAFIAKVAAEFAADEGQFYYDAPTTERELTLHTWYVAAHDNLNAILPTLSNGTIKAIAAQVVADLKAEIEAAVLKPDMKTTAQADDLSTLLTATDINNINVGLEKTKLFVNSLVDYQSTLWASGYKQEIDGYAAQIKLISDTHKDNLNELTAEFARIQGYYVTCVIGGNLCDETKASGGFADFKDRNAVYDATTKVLTLDDQKITVSQALADLNVVKNNAITQSQAVDVYITGTLQVNDLVLTLKHDFNAAGTEIDVPSSMRLYYSEPVTEVRSDLVIAGYEMIWGDFQFDAAANADSLSARLAGSFRIFYRGVQDPQNPNIPNDSPLHFNIENLLLTSVVSGGNDVVVANNDVSTLAISAQASNASLFYPEKKFASFNGFFETNNTHPLGESVVDLLTYKRSTELVDFGSRRIEVEVIDFINTLGKNIRYRFYPDERVEDRSDVNGNGDIEEFIDAHRIEECELESDAVTVSKCGPRSRIYEKRNVQNTINNLWKLGQFQLTTVDGRGRYFVNFPTERDAQNCLVLQPLENTATLSGSLIEQQVLGLNSVRLVSEVSLKNDAGSALPKTLLDVSIVAPREDRYQVNAALSHNYNATTTAANNIAVGTGSNVSVVRVSYDTSADFENAGNFSVVKGGVQLTLGDGSTVTEDQTLTSFISQTFDADSVNYKIIENAEGVAERCVQEVGTLYVKDESEIEQVFYLNYRGVVYATARQENSAGSAGVWVVRYIDGSWHIPASGTTGAP